jgi:hypothetical protein
VRHMGSTPPPRPPRWVRPTLDGAPRDLCALCAEVFQRVLQGELWPGQPAPGEPAVPAGPAVSVAGFRHRVGTQLWDALPRAGPGRMVAAALVVAFGCVTLTSLAGSRQASLAHSEPAQASAVHSEASLPSTSDVFEAPTPLAVSVPAFASARVPLVGSRIMGVGDSVMLAAAVDLADMYGSVDTDAAVGRQAAEAIAILHARRSAGTLGAIVLLQIGHNGALSQAQLDDMMGTLADVRLVLVMNLHAPRPWEAANNALLADVPRRYPNAVVLDWAAASRDHTEYFWADDLHLTPTGASAYAEFVVRNLRALDDQGAR